MLPTIRLPTKLCAVELRGPGIWHVLQWLASFQGIPSLTIVYLPDEGRGPDETDEISRSLGPSLEVLVTDSVSFARLTGEICSGMISERVENLPFCSYNR